MNLRIARKIVKRIIYGYPMNNFGRLYKAINVWEKTCKRFKHLKRKRNNEKKFKSFEERMKKGIRYENT
jgi:hypothetical protein